MERLTIMGFTWRGAGLYFLVVSINLAAQGCAEKASNSLLPLSLATSTSPSSKIEHACGETEYWKRLHHFNSPWLTKQFDYNTGVYQWAALRVNLSVDATKNSGFSVSRNTDVSDLETLDSDHRCESVKNILGSAGYTHLEAIPYVEGKHTYFIPELQFEFHTPSLQQLPEGSNVLREVVELKEAQLSISLSNEHVEEHHKSISETSDKKHKKSDYVSRQAIDLNCEKSFNSEYRFIDLDPSNNVDPNLCSWISEDTYGCLAGRVLPENNQCYFEDQKISLPDSKGGLVLAKVTGNIAINANSSHTLHIRHVSFTH